METDKECIQKMKGYMMEIMKIMEMIKKYSMVAVAMGLLVPPLSLRAMGDDQEDSQQEDSKEAAAEQEVKQPLTTEEQEIANQALLTAVDIFLNKGKIDEEGARAAIQDGADVNARNRNDYSPLDLAIIGKHENSVRLLLDSKADVYMATGNDSPLGRAVGRGTNAIRELLLRGININRGLPCGRKLLHAAVASRNVESIAFLIENRINVDATDSRSMTPLGFLAISEGTSVPNNGVTERVHQMIRMLVLAGASPDALLLSKTIFERTTPERRNVMTQARDDRQQIIKEVNLFEQLCASSLVTDCVYSENLARIVHDYAMPYDAQEEFLNVIITLLLEDSMGFVNKKN